MEEEITTKDILEAIQVFSNSVDDRFDNLTNEMNGKFEQIDGKFEQIDGKFERLENKMDEGFASIRSEIAELKAELNAKIDSLDKRTGEDLDANMKDYAELKIRVEKLERQIQQLQTA